MPVSRAYVAKRLAMLFMVVVGVLIITFVITRIIPARPELLWAGSHPTEEQIEKARRELRLDEPIHVQLYYYLKDFFTGDWGVSWRTRQPVLQDILDSLPATLELVMAAFSIAVLLGIPLGVLAAVRYGRLSDGIVRVFSVLGASAPVFWIALITQLVFSSWLGLLPGAKRVDESVVIETGFREITGFMLLDSLIQLNLAVFSDALKHLVLPAFVLSLYPLGLTARMTRALMIEALNEFHSTTLQVWGLPRRLVVYKYALKNVVAPVIASLGLSFGYTIIGAFMVELVFVWPGIGLYAALALLSFDYPAVIGCVVVVAIIYSVVNMVVDIIHASLDPRVRL
ncbi:MAG: ABC transporter permease [Desulfurococcales archaeon]|nr:ABC transporter permease [Desulfurococcales archaeon]